MNRAIVLLSATGSGFIMNSVALTAHKWDIICLIYQLRLGLLLVWAICTSFSHHTWRWSLDYKGVPLTMIHDDIAWLICKYSYLMLLFVVSDSSGIITNSTLLIILINVLKHFPMYSGCICFYVFNIVKHLQILFIF